MRIRHLLLPAFVLCGLLISGPASAAVDTSPDGKNVYTVDTAFRSNSLFVWERNGVTGEIAVIQRLNGTDSTRNGLRSPSDVVVSPDGKTVYTASTDDAALGVFSRDPATGRLTEQSPALEGSGGVSGLARVKSLVVSPDNRFVYAVSSNPSDSVVAFSRNTTSGLLTFIERKQPSDPSCGSFWDGHSIAISPDGSFLVASQGLGSRFAVLAIDQTTGRLTCLPDPAWPLPLSGASGTFTHSLAVSPDGNTIYNTVNGQDLIQQMDRSTPEVFSTYANFSGGVTNLNTPQGITVSESGACVYVTAGISGGIQRVLSFARQSNNSLVFQGVTEPIPSSGTTMASTGGDANLYIANGSALVVLAKGAGSCGVTYLGEGVPDNPEFCESLPRPPSGPVGVSVNDGATYTNDPRVEVKIVWPACTQNILISNDGGFNSAQSKEPATPLKWRLASSGPERLPKTVYVRFGSSTQNYTDDIILDETAPVISGATLVRSGTTPRSRSHRIKVKASDKTSGVSRAQAATNKKRPLRAQKFSKTLRVKSKARPKWVRVRDGAGNWSRWRKVR